MKKNKLILIICVATWYVSSLTALFDPMSWIKGSTEAVKTPKAIYFTMGDEDKQQMLVKLKEEKKDFESEDKQFNEAVKNNLDKVAYQINAIKERLRDGRPDDFLQKKLSVLNEAHQTLIDLQLSRKEMVGALDQQIKVLEEYLKDPLFKSLTVDAQSFYSFDHLQSISQKMTDQDDIISHLEEQKNILLADLDNRKKLADQLAKTIKEREREQKEIGIGKGEGFKADEEYEFDVKQRADLLDQSIKLLAHKRQLNEQKIGEIKRRLSLLDTKIFVAKEQRRILQEQRSNIKEGLRVEESDIQVQRAELEKKKQKYLEIKEAYYQQRKNLAAEREYLRNRLDTYIKLLHITIGDLRDLDDMVIEPAEPQGYIVLGKVLNHKEHILLLDKRIELLDAEINVEEAKFNRESISVDIIESWHKITMRKFRSEENVENEIRKYIDPQTQAERVLIAFTEKRNTATNFLAIQNKVFENLKGRIKNLEEQRKKFVQSNALQEFYQSRQLFEGSLGLVNDQIELNRKIIEVYSRIIDLYSNTIKQVNNIIGELRTIGPRSPTALSWEGIKSIPGDIELFGEELKNLGVSYFKHLAPSKIIKRATEIDISSLFKFIFKLLLLILLYFVSRMLTPFIARKLMSLPYDGGSAEILSKFGASVLEFASLHFTSIFIWLAFYLGIYFDVITDIFPQVIFYLISIPFLVYLTTQGLEFLNRFNTNQDFIFFTPATFERFAKAVHILAWSTVVLFFFREAFMLAIYSRSDLPIILLALYSLTARLVLISLIKKEDLLEVIPTEGRVWETLRELVENHFYPIYSLMVALIIMSEPHVGYGKYVSYILWSLLGTGLLIRGLMLVHALVKRASSIVFFKSEAAGPRERFLHAKTAYGFFVMGTFACFSLITFYIGARVWGYSITVADISEAFHKPIFAVGEGTTDMHEITVLSILQIISFTICSFFAASAINQFILRRIFDLLMLEQGVQYTISIITYYLIVIVVIMVGLKRIGLGFVVLSLIVPFLLGFGWAVKEYANDFVSYFIILVQRPFKIGDYVKIGGVNGVVRKITPRSIIVRVKNSITVIIPNSKIVNDQIYNWNYSRSFFAFTDIFLTVPYSVDPAEVKVLIGRVLDTNMHVLKNPRPLIQLHEYGEYGFVFMVRGFLSTDNVPLKDEIASDVRFAIAKALRERGIEIAAPAQIYKMVSE